MEKDNNKYVGAFGDFSGAYVPEPKNITSDMWTPISVAPTPEPLERKKRYIPQDSRSAFNYSSVSNQRQRPAKPQNTGRQPVRGQSPQYTQQRPISQGRTAQNTQVPSQKNNNRNRQRPPQKQTGQAVRQKNNSVPQPHPPRKPMPSRQPGQRPTDRNIQTGQKRPPSGRNEMPPSHAKKPISQKEYQHQLQNKRNVDRSNEMYRAKRDKGASHNEIINENSVKKQKSRKIRNIISIIMAVIFVAAFICVYSYSKGAPVQKIVIEGDSIYTDKQIIYVSGIRKGDNMLGIKKKQVCGDIETKLPYIYEAEVNFTLPDTVTISVVPTTEKILINNKNNYICLDDNNKIVSLKKKKLTSGLYRIDGFEAEKAEQGTFYEPAEENEDRFVLSKQIVSCLEQSGLIKSAIINVSDLNDVQITYESRIRIYLGKCEDVESQLALAVETVKHAASGKQKGYIDMRYSNTAYFSEGSM